MDVINNTDRMSTDNSENSHDYFEVDEEFFVIDSENLEDVKTRLYGFAVQPEGIFEKDNMTEEAAGRLDGNGAYVYVERKDGKITIRQDYNGSYGIYLFRNRKYFALSNSFFRLLEHVRTRYPLTLDRDYANHMLCEWLASFAYKETAVREIEIVDKDARIRIDETSGELTFQSEDYHDDTWSLDTAEGLAVLDNWFYRWTTVLRNIKAATNEMQVNLSGGFDSRITFLLMLKSGANLDEIQIHSINDGLHTHVEDYEIASEIAEYYGFTLNKSTLHRDGIRYSMRDMQNIEFYTKMSLHKEMYWKPIRFYHKRYSLPGNGGEAIRSHWDETPEEFKEEHCSACDRYSAGLAEEMTGSMEKILDSAFECVGEKYHIQDKDSRLYPTFLYRDIRSRSHFGKIAVEQYFTNSITLTPMIDPDIRSLKLCTSECQDHNLLMAMIYVRYCPELLKFRFEGDRSIDSETIHYAEKINRQFPCMSEEHASSEAEHDKNIKFAILPTDPEAKKVMDSGENNREIPAAQADQYLKKVFDSRVLRNTFETYFNWELYYYAKISEERNKYFPLRECYGILALASVIDSINVSQNLTASGVRQMDRFLAQETGLPEESGKFEKMRKIQYKLLRIDRKWQKLKKRVRRKLLGKEDKSDR